MVSLLGFLQSSPLTMSLQSLSWRWKGTSLLPPSSWSSPAVSSTRLLATPMRSGWWFPSVAVGVIPAHGMRLAQQKGSVIAGATDVAPGALYRVYAAYRAVAEPPLRSSAEALGNLPLPWSPDWLAMGREAKRASPPCPAQPLLARDPALAPAASSPLLGDWGCPWRRDRTGCRGRHVLACRDAEGPDRARRVGHRPTELPVVCSL